MRAKGIIWLALLLITVPLLYAENPAVVPAGDPFEITQEGSYFISPKWSPDGNTIAVTSSKYQGIWLVSFPGGEIQQLTADQSAGYGMKWSNDGTRIATRIAHFEDRRRYNAVAVFHVRSGERSLISEFKTMLPGTPEWTADDRFVYMNGTDNFRVYPVSPVSGDETMSYPDETVTFIQRDGLKKRNLRSREENSLSPVDGRILNLTISPDGMMMAFEVIGGNLMVSDIDGLNPVDLGVGYAPCWNPAGDKIAYMVTEDDGHRYLSSDIYVINVDGTGKSNITKTPDILEMHPDWSPTGSWIAYDTMEKGQIFIQEIQ